MSETCDCACHRYADNHCVGCAPPAGPYEGPERRDAAWADTRAFLDQSLVWLSPAGQEIALRFFRFGLVRGVELMQRKGAK